MEKSTAAIYDKWFVFADTGALFLFSAVVSEFYERTIRPFVGFLLASVMEVCSGNRDKLLSISIVSDSPNLGTPGSESTLTKLQK